LDYSEFKCKWIDPVSLWNIADETRIRFQEKTIHKPHFFLDTCTKLQYKGFNSNFFMSDYGDETISINKTPSRNLEFY
jgi:hypothetical protein